MKFLRRASLILLIFFIFAAVFYYGYIYPKYTVPILMYHHFGYKGGNTLFVTPENFAKQMLYLKQRKYNVISLDNLVKGIKENRKFGHNTVVITIDDGYLDNYLYAYPVLKKYKFPATIFLITNHIGNNKSFLNWEQIKQMYNNGISFGSHTKSHMYLPSVKNQKTLQDEIIGSKRIIEKNLGAEVDYFAYPIGGFTESIKKLLKKAGFKAALTTNRGLNRYNKDLYELKRIKITNQDMNKPLSFKVKLSGYYNLFRSKKRGY